MIRPATALLACLAAAAGLAGAAPSVAILCACLSFAAIIRLYEAASGVAVPRRLTAGTVLYALAALLFGEAWDGYEAIPALDVALHGLSAAVLAAVGMALALMPTAGARPRTAIWVLSVLAFGFAMMVGALWEVLEFALDGTVGTNTQGSGLVDTMWDVVANLVGALGGTLAVHAAVAHGRVMPVGGLLLAFVRRNPVLYGAWSGPLAQGEAGGLRTRADGPLQRGGQAGGEVVAGE
jgi:hypothetical protein